MLYEPWPEIGPPVTFGVWGDPLPEGTVVIRPTYEAVPEDPMDADLRELLS